MKPIGHIEYSKPSLFKPMEYVVTYYNYAKGGEFSYGGSKAYIFNSLDDARIMSVLVRLAVKLKVDLDDVKETLDG